MDLIADLIVTFAALTFVNVVWFGIFQSQYWSRVFDRALWQAEALVLLLVCHLIKLHLGI